MQGAPKPPWRVQARLVPKLFGDPQPALDELVRDFGPVVEMGTGPMKMVLVGGPAEIAELFEHPTESFRWGHKFNPLSVLVGPGSMLITDGPDHKRQRSSVQTAFSRKRLNRWIPMIIEQVDVAVDRLDPESCGVVNLYDVGRELILEIVVRAFFGDRMSNRATEFGDLLQRAQDYLENPGPAQLPHPFPIGARGKVREDRVKLDALIDSEIAKVRANPTGDPDDILEALVTSGDLSDSEIRDQIVTLVGAGFDTTAASLVWALWHIGLNPDVAEGLRTEADLVLGAPDAGYGRFDHGTLNALGLADRTMRESLRLSPAAVLSPREAASDVAVGGVLIEKGSLIMWSAHTAGRSETVWDHPLEFDPDRFIELNDEQRDSANIGWYPFGGGKRNCIGFMLAQMELTLVISRLVQRVAFEPVSRQLPTPVGMVVNRPKGGLPATVSLRG